MTRIIPERALAAGIERLLASPHDLEVCRPDALKVDLGGRGSSRHGKLFDDYVQSLQRVIPEARRIWLAIIERCHQSTGDADKAMLEAFRFQPAGAGFDSRVVGVIRAYWLACDEMNAGLLIQERVPPQVFLLQWLIDCRDKDAVEVIAGLPYWPIGLDHAGRWV